MMTFVELLDKHSSEVYCIALFFIGYLMARNNK